MKKFLSILGLVGTLFISCNRDNEITPNPEPPTEKIDPSVLISETGSLSSTGGYVTFRYKNGNEIESINNDQASNMFTYNNSGKIISAEIERIHRGIFGNIDYKYDGQGRLISSHYVARKMGPLSVVRANIDKKRTYTYINSNEVVVKEEYAYTDKFDSSDSHSYTTTYKYILENGKVVKILKKDNSVLVTYKYNNKKNAIRNIKGMSALQLEHQEDQDADALYADALIKLDFGHYDTIEYDSPNNNYYYNAPNHSEYREDGYPTNEVFLFKDKNNPNVQSLGFSRYYKYY